MQPFWHQYLNIGNFIKRLFLGSTCYNNIFIAVCAAEKTRNKMWRIDHTGFREQFYQYRYLQSFITQTQQFNYRVS